MGISFSSYASGTTSVAVPAGVQDGDLLVGFFGYDAPSAGAIPSGFTLIDAMAGNGLYGKSAYKIASGESGSYSCNPNTASMVIAIQKTSGDWEAPTQADLHSEKARSATNITSSKIIIKGKVKVISFESIPKRAVKAAPK